MSDISSKSLFKRQKRDPLRGHPIEDPYDVQGRMTAAKFSDSTTHILTLEAHQLRSLRHEGLTTLAQLRRKIQILPHQVKTAIRCLNEMGARGIMADEVGLGKTIEAGIVMKELIARGRARSVLVLTPAALATQWQQELWDKFGERFVKHDDPDFRGFNENDKIVASIDTAKSNQHYPDIIAREWDLVIVDEAHYLKNKKTQRYRLADDITARHALMLTATPIQNNLMELYNLINLIRPGLLGTLQNFEDEYVGDNQGRVLLHAKRLQRLLQQVLIRNRRSETTGITFPERKVETHRVQASEEEYELHAAVTRFIRGYREAFESHLALMILEREVASSAPALSQTLKNMSAKMNDPDVNMAMQDLREQADALQTNSKMDLILEIAGGTSEKMIVFTQFRKTQELLSQRLKDQGISNIMYHGQLTANRRKKALDEFRGDTQVLVATDSGSEGLNLQFCHILVNYDLPWNPMRVEQRIGRVHRIGQESDQVVILNLAVADTIEDHVLQILYEKIKLFEVAIGEMDLILSDVNEGGGLEKRILDIILKTDNDDELKEGIENVEKDLEKGKAQANMIKELDASVFQQFDLSAANDDVDVENKVDMGDKVSGFVLRFLDLIKAERETTDGVTTVKLPRAYWKRMGGVHEFTTDLQVFDDREGEVELLSLGSGFVRGAMAVLEQDGAVGQLRTAEVDEPATLLYYRYYIETIRSEVEAFVSIMLTDKGEILAAVEGLMEVPDGEVVNNTHGVDPEGWDELVQQARIEAGGIIQPILQKKREEAMEEVRRAEKRLEEYYERQKEEVRLGESKIRRKMGEIRNRLYFTEDGVRERKLETEYERLQAQLHESTFKNNRSVEKLDEEMRERLGKEQEKNEPRLDIQLIGATRLLPPTDG